MKWISRIFLAALPLAVIVLGGAAVAAAPNDPDVIPGQYIVVMKDGVSARAAAGLAGVSVRQTYGSTINGFSAQLSDAAVVQLGRRQDVEAVIPDRRVHALPFAPGGPRSVPASATPATPPTGVNRIDAENSTLGSTPVHIAVVDTGSGPVASDYTVAASYNCLVLGCPPGGDDDNGHGSHVAGTAAGTTYGVARGASIYSVKVLDSSGSGSWSTVIAGIDKVTSLKGTIAGQWVINMSLGGGGNSYGNCGRLGPFLRDPLELSICNATRAGVVVVVAGGNSSQDARNFVPAAYPEVIAVGAIADYDGKDGHLAASTCFNWGADDSLASFSNYGSSIDIAAPGVCITSDWLAGGTATISGTSMATPHVVGAIALKMSNGGIAVGSSTNSTNARNVALAALTQVARDNSPPWNACSFSDTKDSSGYGMVYAGGSVGATSCK
jgi:subtilisin